MVDAILGVIGMLLYPLFSIVFIFLDVLQNLFYSFAGIGTIYVGASGTPVNSGNTGAENDTGLLYYLLTSDIVKNILISMLILALFLLIIFTTLAFIKTIYAEKPKSWKDILSSAIKGLTNFIVLPVCCLLGVWVGNMILQAVNGATSTGNATTLSRKLFVCAAYNANVYRGDKPKDDGGALVNEALKNHDWLKKELGISEVRWSQKSSNPTEDKQMELQYYAEVLDQIFAVVTKDDQKMGIYLWGDVNPYYKLVNINYLMLIVGGVFMMYVMINVTYGMVKRVFILLMLFVISPALCALYPLDEGNAVKSWSGDVKKNILSAYGAVAGMNLLFSFLPIIQNIKITQGFFGDLLINNIVQIILMICALFCMNDFISMISGYIGAGNAFADGKSLRGSATGALKKYGKATAEKGVKVYGAFARSNQARKDARASGKSGAASFFTGVGHLGKEGVAGILNAADKSAAGALGLQPKGIKANDIGFGKDKAKKWWESTGIGGLAKTENEENDKAAKASANMTKWKKVLSNIGDDEARDPAVLAELKRQMMASGISEDDVHKKMFGPNKDKFGEKGVIEEKIARFNEQKYDDRKDALEASREIISDAGKTAIEKRSSDNLNLASSVGTTGEALIKAKDVVVSTEQSKIEADNAKAAAESDFDLYRGPMPDVEKDNRLSLGLDGKYTAEELNAQAGDKQLFDSMMEFNRKLESLVKATEAAQKATEAHSKATEDAKKRLTEFEKAMDDAKKISSDAAKSIDKFGQSANKSQKDIEDLAQSLSDEAKK